MRLRDTCHDEESFNEEWNKIYGEDKEDFRTPSFTTWEDMYGDGDMKGRR